MVENAEDKGRNMRIVKRIRKSLSHIDAVSRSLSASEQEGKDIRRTGHRFLGLDQLGILGRSTQLKLKKFEKEFTFNSSSVTDFSLLHDLLIDEEYQACSTLENVNTIVDLGSNVGVSVLYFNLLFPNSTIFAYEPSPQCYRRLEQNTRHLHRATLSNKAAGGSDGQTVFYENRTRSASSSLLNRGNGAKPIDVKVLSFESIFTENNLETIDLLKFDIEGTEYEMFKNARHLDRVTTYIGELHSELIDCDIATFCDLFKGFRTSCKILGPNRYLFFACKNR